MNDNLRSAKFRTRKISHFLLANSVTIGIGVLFCGVFFLAFSTYATYGFSFGYFVHENGIAISFFIVVLGASFAILPQTLARVMESRSIIYEKRFGDLANREESDSELVKQIRELSQKYLQENGNELVQSKIEEHFEVGLDSTIESWIANELGIKDDSKSDVDDISSALHYATAMDEKYQAQISRLAEQQTTSLRVGLAFAILGGVFLISLVVFQVFSNYPSGLETTQMILGNVLRALTVVFMEIFAFFFLRNYRSIFPEIKYYQNERNILQSKIVALRVAISTTKNKGLMNRVFDSFLTPPVDQQLKKEKTTEKVELEKLQNQYDGRFFDLLEKALDVLGEKKEMNQGK